MCLSEVIKIRVKEPITCYKIEKLLSIDNVKKWITYFQGVELERNVIIRPLEKLDIHCEKDGYYDKHKSIYKGAFHSFMFKEDAIKYIKDDYISPNIINVRVVECIIPRKFRYKCYCGVFFSSSSFYSCFASNRIIVTENEVFSLNYFSGE
jgi:hypothetical protein